MTYERWGVLIEKHQSTHICQLVPAYAPTPPLVPSYVGCTSEDMAEAQLKHDEM